MRYFIYIIIFISTYGFSEGKRTNIAFVTICKSGTNLVRKCVFKIIENHYEEFSLDNHSLEYDYRENWPHNGDSNGYHYYFFHFNDLEALDKFIEKSPQMLFIFNIRDPRDVCLSACAYIDKYPGGSNFLNTLKIDYQTWMAKNMEEKLALSINQLKHNEQYQKLFLLQEKYPHILLVEFEALVGRKGGGSNILQAKEIRKISQYLGLDLSSDALASVADGLFGGTKTFQKGQIGSYKEVFNESHYEDFYRVFNEELGGLSRYYNLSQTTAYKAHLRLSVMKSGTGLLETLVLSLCGVDKDSLDFLNFLTLEKFNLSKDWYTDFYIPNGITIKAHMWDFDTNLIHQLLIHNKDMLVIINIRDPRDTCVSLVHFFNQMDQTRRTNYSKLVPENWDLLSEGEKLSFAISRESTIAEQFEHAFHLDKLNNTVLVRFENLVGERGGGSDSLQLEEIQKVADALGVNLTNERLCDIANGLFGSGWTFRKGEIGGYKEVFEEHHYEEFFEVFKEVIEPLSKYYDFSKEAIFYREGG